MKIGDYFRVKADLTKKDGDIDPLTGVSEWMERQAGKIFQVNMISHRFGPTWYFDHEKNHAWRSEWIEQVFYVPMVKQDIALVS